MDGELRRVALLDVGGEVARALWPVLAADLRTARGELEALTRAVRARRDPEGAWPASLARLEPVRGTVRQAGWCLTALASVLGHDLARARGEPDGLRWMAAALRRGRGAALAPDADVLPAAPAGPAGREVCVLTTWALLLALEGAPVARWCTEELGARCRVRVALERPPSATLRARCAGLAAAPGGAATVVLERDALEVAWLS